MFDKRINNKFSPLIHVLIHYTKNWTDLASVVVPVAEAYCFRHGYGLFVKKVPDYDAYNGLAKLEMFNDFLSDGDVGFFLDADTLITHHGIKVESFLKDDKDFYVCDGLNMGAFLIRKTGWGSSFIHYLIESIKSGQSNCEQDAVELFMKYHGDPKIEVLKHPAFNSYMSELYPEIPQPVTEEQGQWVENRSFVLHLPGISIQERVNIFSIIKVLK